LLLSSDGNSEVKGRGNWGMLKGNGCKMNGICSIYIFEPTLKLDGQKCTGGGVGWEKLPFFNWEEMFILRPFFKQSEIGHLHSA
jgi:hypothetical protein